MRRQFPKSMGGKCCFSTYLAFTHHVSRAYARKNKDNMLKKPQTLFLS